MIPILTCSGHLGKLTPMSGPRLPRNRGGVALEEVEDRSCSPSCKPPMVPSWRLWSGPVGRETEGAMEAVSRKRLTTPEPTSRGTSIGMVANGAMVSL